MISGCGRLLAATLDPSNISVRAGAPETQNISCRFSMLGVCVVFRFVCVLLATACKVFGCVGVEGGNVQGDALRLLRGDDMESLNSCGMRCAPCFVVIWRKVWR